MPIEYAAEFLVYGKIALSIILPIPGLFAFYWTWKDRRSKRAAEYPYGVWKINTVPDENGWYQSRFDIKNRWDEPLYAHQAEVRGRWGAKIKLHNPPSSANRDNGTSLLPVTWEFWSSSRSGSLPFSGGTELNLRLPGCSAFRSSLLGQLAQKPPKSALRSQSTTQQGYSTNPSNDGLEELPSINRLRLVITLRSASNRQVRCIIPASWNKTNVKEKTDRATAKKA